MKNLTSRLIIAAPLVMGLAAGAAYAQTAPQPAVPAAPMTDSKTGTMFVAENPMDYMSSKLVGTKVVNAADENVGEVADLMIGQDGALRAVIIGVGGVMGVGTRYVAVAPSAVKMSRTDKNEVKVVLNSSKDELKSAPEFKYQKSS